jgi:ankyrin repeat protein/8-oxo-dGTP pyrophosphatase MutT (NUDIX family)
VINKETSAADKIKSAAVRGFFSTGSKFIRFERYHNINIIEQSQRNSAALMARLMNRAQLPGAERNLYGNHLLSTEEAEFLAFWRAEILPKFTARHGTHSFAYIKKSGYMMPVIDRRISKGNHHNSRTGGLANQQFNYFVLGIGADHSVPSSVAENEIITLHFGRMQEAEKQLFAGMFIGGHLTDYARDITYPTLQCGTTQVTVSYDKKKQLRSTTFKRADGSVICEQLSFADEIVVANPCIDTIFNWLGYKLLEYLRFIGGDFQKQLLACRDVKIIADVFHQLFPSYRFPELKIPLKKIPIDAHYIQVSSPQPDLYKDLEQFHRACTKLDIPGIRLLLPKVDPSAGDASGDTALEHLLGGINGAMIYAPPNALQLREQALQLLLDNGANINCYGGLVPPFAKVVANGQRELLSILLRGTQICAQPEVRLLPRIGYAELSKIIELHDLVLFEKFYPVYLEFHSAQLLLQAACRAVLQSNPKFPAHMQVAREQQVVDSLEIFRRIIVNSDPNLQSYGETPLSRAVTHGEVAVVKALLAHKDIQVNQGIVSEKREVSRYEGWTALHFACWKGHEEIVQLLLNAGANIKASCSFGFTPYVLIQQILAGERDFLSREDRQQKQLQDTQLQKIFGDGSMLPQGLSADQKLKYQAISALLLALDSSLTIPALPSSRPTHTNYAAIACVTIKCGAKTYVLLVRKRNQFDEPHLNYLFPGGVHDALQDNNDFRVTALRETYEETGVDIRKIPSKLIAEYNYVEQGLVEYKRCFFHTDLGACDKLPLCTPKSDVGEALWVDCDLINRCEINGELAMHYGGVPLRYENAFILNAILCAKTPAPQDIIDSQRWVFEQNLSARLVALFVLYLYDEEMPESPDQIRPILEESFASMPEGVLKNFYSEILVSIDKEESLFDKRQRVKGFIVQALKTGRCHIDELVQNNNPLLFMTCLPNKADLLFWLLELGANPNCIKGSILKKYTPLSILICFNSLDTAKILIEKYSANPTLGTGAESALTAACANPQTPADFISYLLGKMDVITNVHLGTVVHTLIENKRLDVLQGLLRQYPLNMNRTYPRHQSLATPTFFLVSALTARSFAAVKLLIEGGADPNVRMNTNTDILGYAKVILMQDKSHHAHYAEMLIRPNQPRFVMIAETPPADKLPEIIAGLADNIENLEQIIALLKPLQPLDVHDRRSSLLDELEQQYLSSHK